MLPVLGDLLICVGLYEPVAYSVSSAEHVSLSVGSDTETFHSVWRYGPQNAMYGTGDSSVVSRCPTVLPRIVPRNCFNMIDADLCYN